MTIKDATKTDTWCVYNSCERDPITNQCFDADDCPFCSCAHHISLITHKENTYIYIYIYIYILVYIYKGKRERVSIG